jgi:hypothetical protein
LQFRSAYFTPNRTWSPNYSVLVAFAFPAATAATDHSTIYLLFPLLFANNWVQHVAKSYSQTTAVGKSVEEIKWLAAIYVHEVYFSVHCFEMPCLPL